MRNRLSRTLTSALALLPSSACCNKDKSTKNPTPLNADEIAIYSAVLRQYISGKTDLSGGAVRTASFTPLVRNLTAEELRRLCSTHRTNITALTKLMRQVG
jgi:hypothetical protein